MSVFSSDSELDDVHGVDEPGAWVDVAADAITLQGVRLCVAQQADPRGHKAEAEIILSVEDAWRVAAALVRQATEVERRR